MSEYRKCPYCGEEILAEAKKCKHCREWLTNQPAIIPSDNVKSETTKSEKVVIEDVPVQSAQPLVTNQQQSVVNVYTKRVREPVQWEKVLPKVKPKNGVGLTGFILSLVSFAISWAPGVNIVLWILGLVFSAVGVFRNPKGYAIAGLVISMIDILLIIILAVTIGSLVSEWSDLIK